MFIAISAGGKCSGGPDHVCHMLHRAVNRLWQIIPEFKNNRCPSVLENNLRKIGTTPRNNHCDIFFVGKIMVSKGT